MIYQYTCTSCGDIFERKLMVAERQVPFSEPCPTCAVEGNIQQFFGSMPAHIDNHKLSTHKRYPDGWKDVCAKIQERSPKSELKNFVNW